MEGWIKIHRKLSDWEWYDDANTFRLFIHLLLKANHKAKKYRGLNLKEGTVLTGRDLLAKELKLSSQQIRTSLSKLKSTNEITIKSNSLGSVIQIVKWLDYQVPTNKTTKEQPKSNQRATTNNNDNKEKNEKKLVKEELLNSQVWKEGLSKHFTCNIKEVEKQLTLFLQGQELDDNLDRPISEIKKHFRAWLSKQDLRTSQTQRPIAL